MINMPPTMLLNSLEGVRRKVRILGLLYGIGIVVAGAIGLLLIVAGLDYLLNLPSGPRVAMMVLASGAMLIRAHPGEGA